MRLQREVSFGFHSQLTVTERHADDMRLQQSTENIHKTGNIVTELHADDMRLQTGVMKKSSCSTNKLFPFLFHLS
jgi:hypothetical protein